MKENNGSTKEDVWGWLPVISIIVLICTVVIGYGYLWVNTYTKELYTRDITITTINEAGVMDDCFTAYSISAPLISRMNLQYCYEHNQTCRATIYESHSALYGITKYIGRAEITGAQEPNTGCGNP